jgi:hypothetical protein
MLAKRIGESLSRSRRSVIDHLGEKCLVNDNCGFLRFASHDSADLIQG